MKQKFKIGEVSKLYGITPDALRFYERKGLLLPQKAPENGYRYYSLAQLNVLEWILEAKYTRVPLAKLSDILAEATVEGYARLFTEQKQHLIEEQRRLQRIAEKIDRRLSVLEQVRTVDAKAIPMVQTLEQTNTLYEMDAELLFSLEGSQEEMEGLEDVITWYYFFKNDNGGIEMAHRMALSFYEPPVPSPLENAFLKLCAEGMIQQRTIQAGTNGWTFWGTIIALKNFLFQQRVDHAAVRVNMVLPRGKQDDIYFADVFRL